MKRIISVLLVLQAMCVDSIAQRHQIFSDRIATLQCVVGDDWLSPAIARLGDRIHFSFDDKTHEYHRYTYSLKHCEADWKISEDLFPSDYCEGFAEDNTIDEVTESYNTDVLYTHYEFSLPNEKLRIKQSGNYKITVYDENEDNEPVLEFDFMVVEPVMGVQLEVSSNTDVDINNHHQQLSMQISYGNVQVTNHEEQIHTVVMQNGLWSSAVNAPKPQFVLPNGLRWDHCRDFIFDGGNEFHKFEILDVRQPTLGVETIKWDGANYHAYLWPSEPIRSYIYDEDANGAFYIRRGDDRDNDFASEYLFVHFTLKTDPSPYPIYINGMWTNDQFTPEYEMEYNEETQCYEKTLLLKQGYYSYQYLMVDDNGRVRRIDSEGNFYQTENTYQVLVYYKGPSDRTDRLIGDNTLSYSNK